MAEKNLPGAGRRYPVFSWYGLMALIGFGFGLLGDRRPFGDDILVHPLVLFALLVGLSLLALQYPLKKLTEAERGSVLRRTVGPGGLRYQFVSQMMRHHVLVRQA